MANTARRVGGPTTVGGVGVSVISTVASSHYLFPAGMNPLEKSDLADATLANPFGCFGVKRKGFC